jgi:hypothetical protein
VNKGDVMNAFLSKISDWLKLSPRYLFPISLVTGFVLFASADILDIFGITPLVTQIRPYLGFIFLLATALLITNLCIAIYSWIHSKYQKALNMKMLQERLHTLTDDEKRVLQYYIDKQTRTQYLPYFDGVVRGLELESVIFKSVNSARDLDRWAFNIQPWAWKYLNEHKGLLEIQDKDVSTTKRK